MRFVRAVFFTLGLVGCALAAQAQRVPVPVMNFESIPVSLSTSKKVTADDVKKAFLVGGVSSGWEVTPKGESSLEAIYRKGDKHTVVVEIHYSAENYSLHYVSSIDMKYADSMPPGYDRSYYQGTRTLASAAADAQEKQFASKPETPYAKAAAKAVIHPFYERWLHDLLDNVRGQLRIATQ